jgi:transitional endoplasmic reticulum ATPase
VFLEKEITVVNAEQRDVGRGIARLDLRELNEFGIEAGDLIGLAGKKKTLAIAWPGYEKDQGKNIIRIDDSMRKNAGVRGWNR